MAVEGVEVAVGDMEVATRTEKKMAMASRKIPMVTKTGLVAATEEDSVDVVAADAEVVEEEEEVAEAILVVAITKKKTASEAVEVAADTDLATTTMIITMTEEMIR